MTAFSSVNNLKFNVQKFIKYEFLDNDNIYSKHYSKKELKDIKVMRK